MTLTLLIDLDDTLLTNDVDRFLKQYFERLSTTLAPYVDPERMMSAMMAAVRAMLSKTDPAGTMEEVFSQSFYPGIGIAQSELRGVFEEFYRNEFPRLRSLTSQRSEAVQLCKNAMEHGWQIAIATNPLFPETAIRQRLVWAGLDPDKFPFAWITSFETAHYSKPHPAYYAEILAQLRWPDGPIVMIGNDFKDDIQPAEEIGLATFWLCENCDHLPPLVRNPLSSQGAFAKLDQWLETIKSENQSPSFDSICAVKATLAATPAVAANFSTLLDQVSWNARPQPSEWSLTEILCHLRDVDREVNLPRIQSVKNGSNPFIPGAVTDPWVVERNYAVENGLDALQDFIEIRTELIHLLSKISEEEWSNPARHAIFGPTTLKELMNFIATHDRTHTQQIWQTIQIVRAAFSAN